MISTCQYPLSTSISGHHLDPKCQSVNVLSVCGEQMPYFRSCCTASSSPCRAWRIHWYLLGTIEKSASHHVQVALVVIQSKSNTYFVCIRMKSPLIFSEKFGLTWSWNIPFHFFTKCRWLIVKLDAASKTLLRDPWHTKSFIFGWSPPWKPFSLLYFLLFRNEIPTAISNRALLVRVVCPQNNCFLWTKNSKTAHDNLL